MKWFIMIGLFLVLVSCAPFTQDAGQPAAVSEKTLPETQISAYADMGTAPELTNEVWLNSDHPLRMSELRGKVVLLEMWTFGCINCQNVLPYLREWYTRYQGQGLVVIGNHFPEFPHEKELSNLKNALKRLEIEYPVAQDNEGKTWSAYNNIYWPTLYLIDKRGHIRYKHIGEGRYLETEKAIQDLLNEPG